MSKWRTKSTSLVILVAMAVAGYLLVTLPPKLVEQYEAVEKLGTFWARIYLGAILAGGALLTFVVIWIIAAVVRNTRRKSAEAAERSRNLRDMSPAEKDREFSDNIARSKDFADSQGLSPELRGEIEQLAAELEAKRSAQHLEIVAFGTISSGKSSLLNSLVGKEVFRSNAVGGTTASVSEIPWPGNDKVVLIDTPGLAEVHGEDRYAEATAVAKSADLVLFVVDGPLRHYERELLRLLTEMEKRVLVCLNKEDWFNEPERSELLAQIREQVAPAVPAIDVVAVRSRPTVRRRVQVLPDGSQDEELVEEPPDLEPLIERMLAIVERDGRDLLMANLLLQSRGLVDEARERILATLDKRAEEIVGRYMWATSGATALNPIPLLDIAGGSALLVKMVFDLANVYKQSIDVDTVVAMLSQLGKNLVAMLGASAAAPALATALGSLLKTIPGIGTIAGGLLQGLAQALVTRWIGRVFIRYFRSEMEAPPGGLVELARQEWSEVTRPDQIRKLVQRGRTKLDSHHDQRTK